MLSVCCRAGSSPVAVSGASPPGCMWASHPRASLVAGHRPVGTWASVGASLGLRTGPRTPELGLRSCSAWAQLLLGIWNLPGPGIEPVSPVLAGRFFTTEPPGRPQDSF